MAWFYLSFADDDAFRGACVVEAASAEDAVTVSWQRGINPGGEIMLIETDDEPPLPKYRLLSKEEIGPGATLGDLDQMGTRLKPTN